MKKVNVATDVTSSGPFDECDELRVAGKVTAPLRTSTVVVVEASGVVEGTIDADVVCVHGTVIGDLSARTRIDLGRNADVRGALRAPVVTVAEGARVYGYLEASGAASPEAADEKPPKKKERIKTTRPKPATTSVSATTPAVLPAHEGVFVQASLPKLGRTRARRRLMESE